MMNSLTRSTRTLHPLHPVIPSFIAPVAEEDGDASPCCSQEEDSQESLLTQPQGQQHHNHIEDDTIVIHSDDEEDDKAEREVVEELEEKVQEEQKTEVEGQMPPMENNTEVVDLMDNDDDDDDDKDNPETVRELVETVQEEQKTEVEGQMPTMENNTEVVDLMDDDNDNDDNPGRTPEEGLDIAMVSSTTHGVDSAQAAPNTCSPTRVSNNERWDVMYQQLLDYKETHDGCTKVPASIHRLGPWVARQRLAYTGNGLDPDREARLEAAGFVWRVRSNRTKNHQAPTKRTSSSKPPKKPFSRLISSFFPKATNSQAAPTELKTAGSDDYSESMPEPTSPAHCRRQDPQTEPTTSNPFESETVDNDSPSNSKRTPAVVIRPGESTTRRELAPVIDLTDDGDDHVSTIDAAIKCNTKDSDETDRLIARAPVVGEGNTPPPPRDELKGTPTGAARDHPTDTVAASSPTQEAPNVATSVAAPYEQQIEQLWEAQFQQFKTHISSQDASTRQRPLPGTLLGWVKDNQEKFRQGKIYPKLAKRLLEAGFPGALSGTDDTCKALLEPEQSWDESCRKILLLSHSNRMPFSTAGFSSKHYSIMPNSCLVNTRKDWK